MLKIKQEKFYYLPKSKMSPVIFVTSLKASRG